MTFLAGVSRGLWRVLRLMAIHLNSFSSMAIRSMADSFELYVSNDSGKIKRNLG